MKDADVDILFRVRTRIFFSPQLRQFDCFFFFVFFFFLFLLFFLFFFCAIFFNIEPDFDLDICNIVSSLIP